MIQTKYEIYDSDEVCEKRTEMMNNHEKDENDGACLE